MRRQGGPTDAAAFATKLAMMMRGGLQPDHALLLALHDLSHGGGEDDAETDGNCVPESCDEDRARVRDATAAGDAVEQENSASRAIRLRGRGMPAAQVFRSVADAPEWRVLAAAWALAEQSGAPFAPALERISVALRSLSELRERRAVLLSGPRMTVRLVSALPPLALLLGGLLGFDPVPVLLGPVGLMLLTVGAGLLGAGIAWARALSKAVERRDHVAGIELELAWIALSGSASPGEALLRVADCIAEWKVEWASFDELCEGRVLRNALAAAQRLGVPVRPLLLEEAEAARVRSQAELESEAERLGVRVLIPLGVCVLPAFVTLGVLPVLFSMLGGIG